jgi:hypothetical protein
VPTSQMVWRNTTLQKPAPGHVGVGENRPVTWLDATMFAIYRGSRFRIRSTASRWYKTVPDTHSKASKARHFSRQQYNNSDGTTTVAQLTEEAAMLCCRRNGLAPADTTATTDSHVPNTSQQCSEDHDNEPQQLTKWVMRCTHEGM